MRTWNVDRILNLVGPVLFFGLAIASTWPLATEIPNRLPMGIEEARTVPFFNLWTIAWNVDCLSNGVAPFTADYWNAPIFSPNSGSFAMSEPQPATLFLAPVYWLSGSLVTTYNFYFFTSLSLNGWVTWLVLRSRNLSWIAALSGAIAMLLLPIVHWQAGVLQLVPIWAIVWTLHSVGTITEIGNAATLEKVRERNLSGKLHFWPALQLALALTITFWMCIHHGLLLSLLCTIALSFLVVLTRNWNCLLPLIVATGISAIAIGPMGWKHHQINRQYGFERDAELIQQLSAEPSDYLTVYGKSIMSTGSPVRPWYLSPGWSKWILGLAAIALIAVGHAQHRKWLLLLAMIVGSAFVLSLGNNLKFGNWNIWQTVTNYVPGFAQVRSVYRFAFFVQIGLVVLAAFSIDAIFQRASQLSSWRYGTSIIATCFAAGWLALDPWPPILTKCVPPEAEGEWINLLRDQPPGALLIMPLPSGGVVRDYELTTEWMVGTRSLGKPLVNGYSGFFPQQHLDLAESISEQGLSTTILEELRSQGVRYIVISPYYIQHEQDEWKLLQELTPRSEKMRVFKIEQHTESKG